MKVKSYIRNTESTQPVAMPEQVSPAVCESHGTWFLGRSKAEACSKNAKGIRPHTRAETFETDLRGTWFLGRKRES